MSHPKIVIFTPPRKLSVGEKTKGTSKSFGQTSYDTSLNDAFKLLRSTNLPEPKQTSIFFFAKQKAASLPAWPTQLRSVHFSVV